MVEIRSLIKSDDFSELLGLSSQFFHGYENYHESFFKIDKLSDEDIVDYLSFCENNTRRVFVAVVDRKIEGYITCYSKEQASYWSIKKVGEISGWMVDARCLIRLLEKSC